MKLNVDDLVEQGLVKKKTYTEGKYKGLSVLKYSRKVFYDNLWHVDDRLLDCRGTVVDEDDNVIVLPFKKVFNLHENGTEVAPEREVILVEKINGFMAAATMTDYGLLISTTGTLDSDYANLARKYITEWGGFLLGHTYLFEICDDSDPHIVKEDEGAYLIGIRNCSDGTLYTEEDCDIVASLLGYKRPVHFKCKFKDLPETKTEGFMVRDAETQKVLCKVKSRHYLILKFFARTGKKKLSKIFYSDSFKVNFDEEYYSLQQYIKHEYSECEWRALNEQERLVIIRKYFYDTL